MNTGWGGQNVLYNIGKNAGDKDVCFCGTKRVNEGRFAVGAYDNCKHIFKKTVRGNSNKIKKIEPSKPWYKIYWYSNLCFGLVTHPSIVTALNNCASVNSNANYKKYIQFEWYYSYGYSVDGKRNLNNKTLRQVWKKKM